MRKILILFISIFILCSTLTFSVKEIAAASVTPVPTGSSGPPLVNCSGGKGIQTAIGCIPLDNEQGLAGFFLKWGLGIGGGIAFVLIVIASYQIMSSSGDPKRLQSGKELLTAAITGLLLLVFSAFLLQFIGVNFLGIF